MYLYRLKLKNKLPTDIIILHISYFDTKSVPNEKLYTIGIYNLL